MIEAVQDYLRGPFKEVEGWCIPHLWQAIEPLHDLQVEMGVQAPVAEIGVYRGKFLIGLVKTKNAPRGNFAIDVYDLQQFNLDGAGKGSLEVVLRNMEICGVPRDAVEIERADSMALGGPDMERIRDRSGGFSLFSVDGCHLPEHTVNDMRIAMQLTRPEGIIFVDDYYNANWPGVQEGVAKLYFSEYPRFVPLLYTCNKLFLCHISFHRQYLARVKDHLTRNFPGTKRKMVRRFGYDTLTVVPDMGSANYLAEAAPDA